MVGIEIFSSDIDLLVIDLINQKQLREKNDDVTYGIQLARNLGYEKPGAKKATKEPNGTIMD